MKKLLHITGICTLLTAWSTNGCAQQQVQYTQYMYNTMLVNPAYAGTGSQLEVNAIHRSQWVGLDGAPRTQNVGINAAAGKVIGLGLNFINDRIGPTNQSFVTGSLAAKIKLTDKVNLSAGINGGIDIINVDFTKGQSKVENDDAMITNIRNRVRPVIGAGLYLYADNWYVGVSSPTFMKKDRYGSGNESGIDSYIHWYAIAGYVFQIGDHVKLKPALMAKVVKGAPITADISLNTLIKEQFTIGAAYRYNDAVSILLGYTLKKAFFVGYSYDINTTKLRSFNSGSHDIILKYNLYKKNMSAQSPRFF